MMRIGNSTGDLEFIACPFVRPYEDHPSGSKREYASFFPTLDQIEFTSGRAFVKRRMSHLKYGKVDAHDSVCLNAKGGPFVYRFSSTFSQAVKLFPRTEFQALVKRNRAERHARGFICGGQPVAMRLCQLGRAHSPRVIRGGLASCEGKLAHLGIKAPSRSTLSYANENRPLQLYRVVFEEFLGPCQPHASGCRKFRFKTKLLSLDAWVIDSCARMFDRARFRRPKGR